VFRFPELASTQPELLSTLVRKLHAEGALGCMRDTSDEMEEIREARRHSVQEDLSLSLAMNDDEGALRLLGSARFAARLEERGDPQPLPRRRGPG